MRWILPMPCPVTHPHTIKLPAPCLMVFLVKRASKACPGFIQQYWRPSDLNNMNLDSSKNITLFQSSTVHPLCSKAHSRCFSLCTAVKKSLAFQTWHNNPCSFKHLWTVRADTFGKAFFWTSVAFVALTLARIWVALAYVHLTRMASFGNSPQISQTVWECE